eukprot:291895-Pyramimonas_sp.AAC.2
MRVGASFARQRAPLHLPPQPAARPKLGSSGSGCSAVRSPRSQGRRPPHSGVGIAVKHVVI